MATQVQHLQEELIRAEARLGKDAPWVRALRQQLEGYRSMEANREQRFLTGAIPRSDSADAKAMTSETEEDATIVQDRRRFRALQSSRAQQAQTPASSQSQSSTHATTASTSSAKPNTSK